MELFNKSGLFYIFFFLVVKSNIVRLMAENKLGQKIRSQFCNQDLEKLLNDCFVKMAEVLSKLNDIS